MTCSVERTCDALANVPKPKRIGFARIIEAHEQQPGGLPEGSRGLRRAERDDTPARVQFQFER